MNLPGNYGHHRVNPLYLTHGIRAISALGGAVLDHGHHMLAPYLGTRGVFRHAAPVSVGGVQLPAGPNYYTQPSTKRVRGAKAPKPFVARLYKKGPPNKPLPTLHLKNRAGKFKRKFYKRKRTSFF